MFRMLSSPSGFPRTVYTNNDLSLDYTIHALLTYLWVTFCAGSVSEGKDYPEGISLRPWSLNPLSCLSLSLQLWFVKNFLLFFPPGFAKCLPFWLFALPMPLFICALPHSLQQFFHSASMSILSCLCQTRKKPKMPCFSEAHRSPKFRGVNVSCRHLSALCLK